jgi:hypothetical protein
LGRQEPPKNSITAIGSIWRLARSKRHIHDYDHLEPPMRQAT